MKYITPLPSHFHGFWELYCYLYLWSPVCFCLFLPLGQLQDFHFVFGFQKFCFITSRHVLFGTYSVWCSLHLLDLCFDVCHQFWKILEDIFFLNISSAPFYFSIPSRTPLECMLDHLKISLHSRLVFYFISSLSFFFFLLVFQFGYFLLLYFQVHCFLRCVEFVDEPVVNSLHLHYHVTDL